MRLYPAIDVAWPVQPSSDEVERLLAALDDESPTAVEDRASGIRVFFASAAERDRAAARIRTSHAELTCTTLEVSDESWAERSQASLQPVHVGSLTIDPGHETAAASPTVNRGQITIVVRPSMGFGTGHHASTRLCLRLVQDEHLAGRRVIDVGTGSGVLAIAAWVLGAGAVLAIDTDPDALTAARENAALNGLAEAVRFEQADLAMIDVPTLGGFDLALANLTGALLTRQASRLTALVRPGGLLILSGVLVEEEAAVTEAFQRPGCAVIKRLQEDEWIGLTLRTLLPSPDSP